MNKYNFVKVCHKIRNKNLRMPLCFSKHHALQMYLWAMDV
jgi:hypothetical protein